jgi:ElaB/YqjD/DUF883 family membrane-anchored ribosome-binding protein
MQYEPYERQNRSTATIDTPTKRGTEHHSPAHDTIETPARQRLARQGRVLKHDVQKLGTLAKDAANESLQAVSARTQEELDTQREKLADIEHQAARKVRANPWKSIAAAAGVGTLLGAFLRR